MEQADSSEKIKQNEKPVSRFPQVWSKEQEMMNGWLEWQSKLEAKNLTKYRIRTEMKEEPEIIINGMNVGSGCAMTIRVGIEVFANELSEFGLLGDDPDGKSLTEKYLARIDDIRRAMGVIK